MKRQILTDVLNQKPPDTLYHYTTQNGLLGIIKDKEIWATHTQYLNDQQEYLHALKLVHKEIDSIKQKTTNSKHKILLRDMDEDVYGNESMNICVCSFSEVRDSLPQWRAYSGASSGYAIGFSGELLSNLKQKKNFYLAKCVYALLKQRALIRALVEEVLEENIRGEPWKDEYHIPIGGNLCAYLHRYAPVLKNFSFKHEREWRIISRPLSCTRAQFDFRPGNSMLIPYYKFSLVDADVPFQINRIIVGPTPHPEQAKMAAESLLVRHGLRNVPVINSKVPYRNW
jgi:Protein of unknown function (DUF2971)